MVAVGLQVFLPALRQELVEVGARTQARMNVAIDDAQPRGRGRFLLELLAVDDFAHANLLRTTRRASDAERFPADCRHTCARRCFAADAAGRDRRRRTANADSRTRTGTSCR